jgi:hypothetical protein
MCFTIGGITTSTQHRAKSIERRVKRKSKPQRAKPARNTAGKSMEQRVTAKTNLTERKARAVPTIKSPKNKTDHESTPVKQKQRRV